MTIYRLNKTVAFPNPEEAEEDGLLAVGGDLSPERLINAYALGIFPWFNPGEEIMWWSPNPRMILYPEKFKVSKSLRQIIRQNKFTIKVDTCFEDVIRNCKNIIRENQSGTWITDEMEDAYISLHEHGLAHSVEVFNNGKLVGGLYGISLGSAFFGESMFHKESNASKIAFYYLSQIALKNSFDFIDCQMTNSHLVSLGAEELSRSEFLIMLDKTQNNKTYKAKWNFDKSTYLLK